MMAFLKKQTKYETNNYIWFSLCLIGVFLALLFWQSGTLSIYDASGHVAAVNALRSFWPFMSGWNSKELLGFPQGLFYPSLFHYLAVGLSFLIGVSSAIKILIAIALVGLPVTIFWFAKNYIKNRFWATLATLLVFGLLLFLPDYLGGGVRSVFRVGLLPSFFAMPILFLFLAEVPQIKSQKFFRASLLFGLLLLTHLVAALAGGVFLAVYFLSDRLFEKDFKVLNYFKFGLVTFGLTSFFWLPFLVLRQYTSVTTPAISPYLWPNLIGFLISGYSVVVSLKKKQQILFSFSLASASLLFLTTFDAIVTRLFGFQSITHNFYLFRFQPFAYIFFLVALVIVLAEFKVFNQKRLEAISLGFLSLLLVGFVFKNPALVTKAKVTLQPNKEIQGRFLETFRRLQTFPAYYELQTSLNQKNKNAAWANSLFAESGSNSQFISSLIKSLNPKLYPEKAGVLLETKFIDQKRVSQALSLLGVNWLVNFDTSPKNAVATWTKAGETKYFNLQTLPSNSLFEVPKFDLTAIRSDWNKQAEKWWLAKGPITNLPYLLTGTNKEIQQNSVSPTTIILVNQNSLGTHYQLKISGEKKIPVLAKISYFPSWKATSQGKEIPIYRAGPSLMLFEAQGDVILEYQTPFSQVIGYTISAATVFYLVFLLVKKRKNFRL